MTLKQGSEGRQRRSLTHVGGRVDASGPPDLSAILGAALDVATSTTPEGEREARAHLHGFHTYPARMHPLTARRLIEGLSPRGGVVLDPFCGSGTVVLEAALLGRVAEGCDLNPLAVRLARLKTWRSTDADRERLLAAARDVQAVAEDRRHRKAGASVRYGKEDVALFDPHVLLALDGLRFGIDGLADRQAASVLEMVLSAILVKLSRKGSDTSREGAPRRIAPSFPARLFVMKTEELVGSLAHTASLLGPTRPKIEEDDARRLTRFPPRHVDLIVTSPPYAGVYDYVEHHALRLRWLRLSAASFEKGEIGAARRHRSVSPREGLALWEDELGASLLAMERVLRTDGRLVLLIADSASKGMALRADEIVARTAARARLRVVARASQERPHFHRGTAAAFRDRPRREHGILLSPLP